MRYLAVLVLVTACAPGYSLSTLNATPKGMSVEYTYSVEGEYQAALQRAAKHCAAYGLTVHPDGAPVKIDMDRAVQTFDCR